MEKEFNVRIELEKFIQKLEKANYITKGKAWGTDDNFKIKMKFWKNG